MIERKKLKSAAREAMREAKPHPFWVTLAVSLILAVLIVLSMYISGSFETYKELADQMLSGELVQNAVSGSGLQSADEETNGFGSFLVLALELMTSALSVGYILYCLRVSRHTKASFGDVFDVFGMFLRAVLVRIMKGILMFLWGLVFGLALSVVLTVVLLVTVNSQEEILSALNSPWLMGATAVLVYIPMIAASYFYRLAEYFMIDNPGMSAFQCLTMSRMAMRGHKWELFTIDLSFLGWFVLSVIPFVAVWVQPYVTITTAGFYNEISPQFLHDMEQKLRERQQAVQAPFDSRGYHVPGQNRKNEDDEDESE